MGQIKDHVQAPLVGRGFIEYKVKSGELRNRAAATQKPVDNLEAEGRVLLSCNPDGLKVGPHIHCRHSKNLPRAFTHHKY